MIEVAPHLLLRHSRRRHVEGSEARRLRLHSAARSAALGVVEVVPASAGAPIVSVLIRKLLAEMAMDNIGLVLWLVSWGSHISNLVDRKPLVER